MIRIIVIDSDQHCGSSLGLLCPQGIRTTDDNLYLPGPAIKRIWDLHEQYVADVSALIARYRSHGAVSTHYINLGDLTDGDHHGTHQIVGRDLGVHVAIARDVLVDGFLRLGFDSLHFVGGTPAHVGQGAALEKTIASSIASAGYPVVRDPRTDHTVWSDLTMDVGAYRLDFKHHGRAGTREHTRRSLATFYAYDIHGAYTHDGRRAPDIAVRAHNHKMSDSGPDLRGVTRVLGSGCWQYASEWVRSRSIESRPDFGGWVIVIDDTMIDPYDVIARPYHYQHPLETEAIWRP